MGAFELQPARLQYSRTAKLGKGAFGDVYRGILDAESTVAVKVLRAGNVIAARQFRRELRRYARLSVNGVVNFYGAARSGGPVAHIDVFVTELMQGGSLLAALDEARANGTRLNPTVTLRIAEMIANGLAEIHACGFSHGDVKSSNILLSAPVCGRDIVPRLRAKFVDFGLSRNLTSKSSASVDSDDDEDESFPLAQPGTPTPIEPLGTPAYLAPEAWRGSSVLRKPRVAYAADVYALGILLYELDTGLLPWPGMSEWGIFGEVYHSAERPAWPKHYEESITGLRSIIEKCWAQDFMNRPTAESVAASLRELRRNAGLSSPSISTPPSSPGPEMMAPLDEPVASKTDVTGEEHSKLDEHSKALQAMRMIPLPDSPGPSSPLPHWIADEEVAACVALSARNSKGLNEVADREAAGDVANHTNSTLPSLELAANVHPDLPNQNAVIDTVEEVQQGAQQEHANPTNDISGFPQTVSAERNVCEGSAAPEAEPKMDELSSPILVQNSNISNERKPVDRGPDGEENMLKFFGPPPPSPEGEDGEDDFRISITSSQAFADAEGSVKSDSVPDESHEVDSLTICDANEVEISEPKVTFADAQTPPSKIVSSPEVHAENLTFTPENTQPVPSPEKVHPVSIQSERTVDPIAPSADSQSVADPAWRKCSFAGPPSDLISSNSEKSCPRSPSHISEASSSKGSNKSRDSNRASIETPASPKSVPSSAFARARVKSPGNMRFVGRPQDVDRLSERSHDSTNQNPVLNTTQQVPVPRLPTIPNVEDDSSKLLSFNKTSHTTAPVTATRLDYPLKAEVQANNLNAVLNALHNSVGNPDNCAHALRALGVLVSASEENAVVAVEHGVLEPLAVAVARYGRRHAVLARTACDVIFHLGTRQMAPVEYELRANSSCEHVINVMRWHPANVQVMQAASMALSALCRSSVAMCAIIIPQGGLNAAQRALARAANAFDGDVPVAVSALDAIAALSESHPLDVVDSGTLSVVLLACEAFAREEIDENVVRVLYSVSKHAQGRDALLVEKSAVPILAKLMERCRSARYAGPTLVMACSVVSEMAMGPSALANRALVGSSIVESVLMAMALVDSIEPFHAGTALAVHSLVAVRRLSALGLDMCTEMHNAHTLDAVVTLVNCRLENMDVAIQAALFVVSLTTKLSGGPHLRNGTAPVLDMLRALDETWLLEVRVLEPVRRAINMVENAQGVRVSRTPVDTIQTSPVEAKSMDRISGRGLFRWRKR